MPCVKVVAYTAIAYASKDTQKRVICPFPELSGGTSGICISSHDCQAMMPSVQGMTGRQCWWLLMKWVPHRLPRRYSGGSKGHCPGYPLPRSEVCCMAMIVCPGLELPSVEASSLRCSVIRSLRYHPS